MTDLQKPKPEDSHDADQRGDGAIAQGQDSLAIGSDGVMVGSNVSGNIVVGDKNKIETKKG